MNNEQKEKKRDRIIMPKGVEFFAKMILKLENRLAPLLDFKFNVSEIEFTRRLMNTLIICNHDLFIFDFYGIPYILRKYDIPLSIVVNEGFITDYGTVFNDMTKKFNVKLIPRINAVSNIIDHINDGRSVVIFYDPREYDKIENKKSLPIIINTTKCRPIYLQYRTGVKLRKHDHMRQTDYINYNIKNIVRLLGISCIGQHVSINIKISENFDTYEEFIKNKKFIKPIYIK